MTDNTHVIMSFWKPGTKGPNDSAVVDRESEREGGEIAVHNPFERYSLSSQRTALPIYEHRTELLYLVENFQVTIVVGHTGCGKTTQLPQYLFESGWCSGGRCVACTQPRRVAAAGVAQRVADERGVVLGESEVGYTIRFDNRAHPTETRIKYMTDGMLVRETMVDPLLTSYSVIMLDEAHERSLYTDILVGLLKKVMAKRKDLRVIVSSATLDAEEFYNFFNTNETDDREKDTAAVISLEGKMFPVEIHYLREPTSDYIRCTVQTILEVHRNEGRGDILAFLTGQEEIEIVCKMVKEEMAGKSEDRKLLALPLFAGLPMEQQVEVFQPPSRSTRKVIVSTNIAETSVTIPGIVFVIDCGFVKLRTYEAESGVEALIVCPTSQASCNQRAGRAGRVTAGKCYRLFPESEFLSLPRNIPPEMERSNLSTVVMQLKSLGIDDVLHFPFLSPPPALHLSRALEHLFALDVLDDDCRLTPHGQTLVEFPIDPPLAKMLITSGKLGCSEEILSIAAMLSVPSAFVFGHNFRSSVDRVRRLFGVHEGDHIALLNVYNAFVKSGEDKRWCGRFFVNYRSCKRAVQVRAHLRKYMKRWKVPMESCDGDTEAIRRCIIHGYFANAAMLTPSGAYETVRGGHQLHIHPSSVLFKTPPAWVVFHEVIRTTKEYMRDVIEVDPKWLSDIAPHYYEFRQRKGASSTKA